MRGFDIPLEQLEAGREAEEDALALQGAREANGYKWPDQLTSGVMFFMGRRITRKMFERSTQGERDE